MRHRLSFALAIACALAQAEARAQSMRDPMEPPASKASAQARGATPSHGGLQVVITSPSRNLAVIDGNVVPLGAPVRNGTLGSVTDSLAVLRKNGDREVLLMHPSVDKKPARRERP